MGRVLPILFNGEMVRAILDGRKTVTRRVAKYKYSNTEMKMHTDKYGTRLIEIQKDIEGETRGKNPDGSTWRKLLPYIEKKAPYRKDDILYVRETWNYAYDMDDGDKIEEGTGRYIYYADDSMPFSHWVDPDTGEYKEKMPWRPSIHMPKEAARIWLKITDVRVRQLHDMWPSDIPKEGLLFKRPYSAEEMRLAFSELWNSTIKESDIERYGWDANPWVWVIEFERCGKPEEG